MNLQNMLNPSPYTEEDSEPSQRRLGLLSRTVFQSPIAKWILPGKIRHGDRNDVLFVGDFYVQLKEWNDAYGGFQTISDKNDFPSRIACARVLPSISPFDGPERHQNDMDIDQKPSPPSPPRILMLLLESSQLVLLTATQLSGGSTTLTSHTQPLPAFTPLRHSSQMLAIDPHSRATAIAGPDGPLVLQRLSIFDGRSESIASLVLDTIVLPIDMTVMQLEFLFPPTSDGEKIILVVIGAKDGRLVSAIHIWDAPGLLRRENIVSSSRRLGRGESMQSLCDFGLTKAEHGTPCHLIPLKQAHFMLVCDKAMAVYQISMDGHSEQTSVSSLDRPEPSDAESRDHNIGNSLSQPRWVCWAKPNRRPGWVQEGIYLGREDGFLRYILLEQIGTKRVIAEQSDAGKLDCALGPAFAILDVPQREPIDENAELNSACGDFRSGYPDAFICMDQYGSGGVFKIGFADPFPNSGALTREEAHRPRRSDTFTSWTPIRAVAVGYDTENIMVRTSRPTRSDKEDIKFQEKVYVASGEAPYGSIAEIRHGLMASASTQVSSTDLGLDLNGVNDTWLVRFDGSSPFLVLSFPWKTVWAKIGFGSHITYLRAFDQDESTLATTDLISSFTENASKMKTEETAVGGIVAQVTSTKIILIRLTSSEHPTIVQSWSIENSKVAAIDHERGFIVTAAYNESRFVITLRRLTVTDGIVQLLLVGSSADVDSEPSCATFSRFSVDLAIEVQMKRLGVSQSAVHVGTTDGFIYEFAINGSNGLHLASSSSFPDQPKQPGQGIASIVAISSEREAMVVCGLRNGLLRARRFGNHSNRDYLIHVGNSPVKVHIDDVSFGQFFAHCGLHACSLDFRASQSEEPIILAVAVSMVDEASLSPMQIDALCIYTDYWRNQYAGTKLVSISNARILVGRLDRRSKPIVYRTSVPGTPQKLLHSNRLRALLVASAINHVDERSSKRFAISTVLVLDPLKPAYGITSEDEHARHTPSFQLDAGERLTDMIEATIRHQTDAAKNHNFIIVSSTANEVHQMDTGPTRVQTGRLRWLKLSPGVPEERKISCQKVSFEERPITAMCEIERASQDQAATAFVYCCGHDLKYREFDAGTSQWPKSKLWTLPSPATKISMDHGRAFVSTQAHAVIVFSIGSRTAFPVNGTVNFRPLIALAEPQHSLSHLKIEKDAVITSARGGPVSILEWQDREVRHVSTGQAASVQARLHTSVNHLIKANTRPPWKGSEAVRGVVERDIFATSVDGSFYMFTVVTEPAARLLRFMQVMCMRNREICSMLGHNVFTKTGLEPRTRHAQDWHVDGDILVRLIEREDAREVLGGMLDAELVRGVGEGVQLDFPTAAERRGRFYSLMRAAAVWTDSADGEGESVSEALRWMHRLLEIPF